MKRQLYITVIFLTFGVTVPWLVASSPVVLNHEPEPEFILAAVIVTTLAFVMALPIRWARKVVVEEVRARKVREATTNPPSPARMSLTLAAHAALDDGEGAEGQLREAINSATAIGLSPEARDRLIALADSVSKELAGARRELEDLSR